MYGSITRYDKYKQGMTLALRRMISKVLHDDEDGKVSNYDILPSTPNTSGLITYTMVVVVVVVVVVVIVVVVVVVSVVVVVVVVAEVVLLY